MKLTEADILFEDNHLIVVNKKPSQIVQGDKSGDKPLNELVKDFLKEKYNKPGNVFAGVVHRLDRPVSGVVVFAKTSKALSRLNELFKTRVVTKTYWAVVKNKPPQEEGHLLHFMIKNEAKNMSKAFKEPRERALKAELDYKVLASSDNYYLLEVTPLTGRHHQIRVQLSSIGCPIKGDLKYGFDRSNKDASIHLHARKLSFIHPVKNEKIEVIATPPYDALWNYFTQQVSN
ncbi:MAG: RluA family pseudouridine synthase [Bacteroidia bacterium]